MTKELKDLTMDELKSLQGTLALLKRAEMLKEVEKEIKRRNK